MAIVEDMFQCVEKYVGDENLEVRDEKCKFEVEDEEKMEVENEKMEVRDWR